MFTNEDRHEVAKRLRILATHKEVDKEVVEDALGLYMGGCIDGYDPVSVSKLADLIEPEPERTCKNLYKRRDKKGRIPVDNGVCFVCSECDAYVSDAEGYHSGLYPSYNSDEFHYDIEFSYCPNCGARIQK